LSQGFDTLTEQRSEKKKQNFEKELNFLGIEDAHTEF
jgi:hypothetical protein